MAHGVNCTIHFKLNYFDSFLNIIMPETLGRLGREDSPLL